MVVTVNGKPMELPEGLTIEDLLVRLAVPRQFTAVALNREIAPKASYTTTDAAGTGVGAPGMAVMAEILARPQIGRSVAVG